MKSTVKMRILIICVLSILAVNNIYAQWDNLTPPYLYTNPLNQRVGSGIVHPPYQLSVAKHISIDTLIVYPNSVNNYIGCYMIGDTTILHNNGVCNVFGGYLSGVGITTGYSNAFYGYSSGFNNTIGYQNTSIGDSALFLNIEGNTNVCVGYLAGYSTTFSDNVFVGAYAGKDNTGGGWNTFVGYKTGQSNLTGNGNSFYGKEAGASNTTGALNTYVGDHCSSSSTTGYSNVCVGWRTGDVNNGENNVLSGDYAAFNLTSGACNSFYGDSAGLYQISGDSNLYLGGNAQLINNYTTLSNSIAIGANTIVTHDHKMILADNNYSVGIGLSNDAVQFGPQNKLEINYGTWTGASAGYHFDAPPAGSGIGFSGLRFRDMTAKCSTQANPGPGVLAVDTSGNVIYVKDTSQGFAPCPGNSLTNGPGNNIGINLDSNNVYFSGQPSYTNSSGGIGINSVGFGYDCGSTLGARVDIIRSNVGAISSIPIALRVINKDVFQSGPISSYGIYSLTNGANGSNYAGYFVDSGAASNIGLYGIATGTAGKKFYGVEGVADGHVVGLHILGDSVYNYGVYGSATCIDTGKYNFNYGVYGTIPLTDTTNANSWAGYFNGKVNVIGQCHATVFTTSDQQFKQNITPIADALVIINQFAPKTYFWKTSDYPQMRFTGAKQWGFVAQDVDQFLPELTDKTSMAPTFDSLGNVITAGINYEGINYAEITPIAVRAIQQLDSAKQAQKSQIDNLNSTVSDLQNQINNLTTQINNCCNSGSRTSNGGDNNNNGNGNNVNIHTIDLNSMSSSPILFQNQPNPFGGDGGTKIKYFIPGNITNAQISFFDEYGNEMSVFTITETGMGELNVTSANLANGVYSYSLIINNKVIDTKRMVKTQ